MKTLHLIIQLTGFVTCSLCCVAIILLMAIPDTLLSYSNLDGFSRLMFAALAVVCALAAWIYYQLLAQRVGG